MVSTIIFLIGAPGSGKGTLGRRLCEQYGMYHFSVGDYMTDLRRSPGSYAEVIQEAIQTATLLPGNIIIPMLQRKLEKEEREGGYRVIVIDGFPREVDQAVSFEEQIGKPALAIYLNCPKDEAKRRYLSRNLPGRIEDTTDMFEKRYAEYDKNNTPILERYRQTGILEEVDSSTETQESYQTLLDVLSRNAVWNRMLA
ncbi:hypothetical protein LOZ51_006224 [Ophidiomyces ophidiicola]|nr:hypothetical protein LOZ55_003566 [Ophidiomyces ophidiicola]KAI1985876.1 hypothetical protein LOZ51_006224 [Ophidiomyces ophidiicola]KAI1995297.1 hypothetical protein LOZ54_000611 [Ophidiomyces ophidiicola]